MANFAKHVGTGKNITIDGEEYCLLPLTVNELPLFFQLMKAFKNTDPKAEDPNAEDPNADIADALENFDKDTGELVTTLIKRTLEKSYPNEDVELRDRFGLKYMGILLGAIIEINMDSVDSSQNPKINKLLEKQKKKQ